jgi:hypothetical protein
MISGTLGGRRITDPVPIGEACLFAVLFSSPSPNVRQNPNNPTKATTNNPSRYTLVTRNFTAVFALILIDSPGGGFCGIMVHFGSWFGKQR